MSDIDAQINAVRVEMASSRGDQVPLNAKLEELYRAKFPEAGTPRPDGYTPVDTAPVRDFTAERTALRAQMQQPFADPSLQAQLEETYRDEDAALALTAPERVAPDTLEWPAATEEAEKNAFCALAREHGVTDISEVQAAIRELTNVPPMPADPEQGRAVLTREFGAALPLVLAHAERVFGELPQRLQRLIQEPEMFFSPPVLRHLNLLWERTRRGGR